MKLADIKGKDSRELRSDLQSLEKEAWTMKFHTGDETTNPARPKAVRRTIARIKTVLRQRDLAKQAEATEKPQLQAGRS
jgi:large subunit ribosomal protein L29